MQSIRPSHYLYTVAVYLMRMRRSAKQLYFLHPSSEQHSQNIGTGTEVEETLGSLHDIIADEYIPPMVLVQSVPGREPFTTVLAEVHLGARLGGHQVRGGHRGDVGVATAGVVAGCGVVGVLEHSARGHQLQALGVACRKTVGY